MSDLTVIRKLSSVTTLERDPGKLIPFPSDPSTLVVVSSLSQLHLFSISEPAKKLDLSLDLTSIAPYDCFKYHLAHSLLALLCSDGIIHILSLSEPPNSRIPKLQSLCTLFSLPKPPPLYESNKERRIASEEEKAAQMYSVLVVSPKRVLTGHRDGKIRVFDISRARNAALSDASMRASSSMAEGLQQINTPTCVVQAHRQNRGVVNSMLALPSQDDALSYRLVSTGTDGFAKVWSLHPQSSSSPSSFQTDTLLLLVSIKLFDHAITCRSLSEHGQWLFVAGKDGGKEDNVCGLYNGIKAWKLPADGNGEVVVKKIGSPCPVVWDLAYVRGGKLFVSLMRRGKACAEVWDVRDLGE